MLLSENYLDPDFAYYLGLVVARGTLYESGGDRKVIIEFPHKNLIAEGITKTYNQQEHLQISLNQIAERLRELFECDTRVQHASGVENIVLRFSRNSMGWRNTVHFLGSETSFHHFKIPHQIFGAPLDMQKEFVRGIADCAGFIRESNNYMGLKRRVYLEINNKNWRLPVQICCLLQKHLDVPVHTITWGHPNIREPQQTFPGTAWAREHQVKIFSEAFEPIGFYVQYKDEILHEFIASDRKISGNITECNPNPRIRRISRKPKHPEENNPLIPPEIRGKHFDASWRLCRGLGCDQMVKIVTPQITMFPGPEDEEEKST